MLYLVSVKGFLLTDLRYLKVPNKEITLFGNATVVFFLAVSVTCTIYCTYTGDLPKWVKRSQYRGYADDSICFYSKSNPSLVIEKLESEAKIKNFAPMGKKKIDLTIPTT